MPLEKDEPWYKHAIIYQAHVRTFYDSNGDGIGDFPGLDEKLDYLVDLGINTIWLMPFFPSPLRDDGYDIADYYSVHSSYGTLEDFKNFLVSAHERRISVIIEMVLNHTSDQHPWFQQSRATFLSRAALLAAVNANFPSPRLLSISVRTIIIILVLSMAFEEVGVAEQTMLVAFGVAFGAMMLGLAIAFGTGGKDLAQQFLEKRFVHGRKDEGKEDGLSPL